MSRFAFRSVGLVLAAVLFMLGTGAATARADAAIETIVQDDALLLHGQPDEIARGLERMRELGIDRIRVTAGWSVIAPNPDSDHRPDFDATDPAAYRREAWEKLDRIVRMSHEAGIRTMIDIAFWAPRWATADEADGLARYSTEVDAAEYARFATAVAARYSGSWAEPRPAEAAPAKPPAKEPNLVEQLVGGSRPEPDAPEEPQAPPVPLPRVDVYTIWNEPNHPGFLRPQWVKADGRWIARSPQIYREMVRAAYPAIKSAAPASKVLIGGTAPYGSSRPGGHGVPPLRFLRELACVNRKLRPVETGTCAGFERLPGDGWAHHPYSLRMLPGQDTENPDKLPVAATARLTSTLKALVDRGRLAPENADVYMTEYGYETNGPDPEAMFSPEQQPSLLAHAEYLATRDPAVKSWPQFQLYDRPAGPIRPGLREYSDWQTGLFYADGSPKPAAATFATPIHSECVKGSGGRWVFVWGRLRQPGNAHAQLEVADEGGEWRRIDSNDRPLPAARTARRTEVRASSGEAVTRFVLHRPGARYRLRYAAGEDFRHSPATTPLTATCLPVARQASARKRKRR